MEWVIGAAVAGYMAWVGFTQPPKVIGLVAVAYILGVLIM